MTLFDMIHNADKLGMEDIVRRQKIIGGVDLFDVTPKDPSWSSEKMSKIQWITFLARFHAYVKANKASGFAMSWSQWSKEHKDFQPNIDHLVVDRSNPNQKNCDRISFKALECGLLPYSKAFKRSTKISQIPRGVHPNLLYSRHAA